MSRSELSYQDDTGHSWRENFWAVGLFSLIPCPLCSWTLVLSFFILPSYLNPLYSKGLESQNGIPTMTKQTNKKTLLQIYEITLLKGVGYQSVDLSNFRSECSL